MNVVFFNHFHNGDIHVSRGFIRKIMEKAKEIHKDVSFCYTHKNYARLLVDIDGLMYDRGVLANCGNEHNTWHRNGDTVYINTWYAQGRFKHMNRYGISMDCLYSALDENCIGALGFSLSDIGCDVKEFFPIIDYSKFYIGEAKKWLDEHTGKKIFISNGKVLSGQAHEFNMNSIIESVAKKHNDKIFILSNNEGKINLPNVIYSSDTIKKNGNDLNENAFLSEHCDVVVGRASGTFSFALTQKNLFDRNIKFLCFSNLVPKKEGKFWLDDMLSDKINYTSSIMTTNENNQNRIIEIIGESI